VIVLPKDVKKPMSKPMSSSRSKRRKLELEKEAPEQRKKKLYSILLVAVCVIIGLGIVVDNISEIYMHDKNTATISTPLKVMRGADNTFLLTTYNADGTPAGDLPVEVVMEYDGETYDLYSGKTDESGSVQPVFSVPELGAEGDKVEMVITAGSEVIEKEMTIDTPVKVFISTDKPIYQPSQMVHIRALSFEDGAPVTGEDAVEVELQAPDGNKIFRKSYTPNEFGIIDMDYPLSDQLPMGDYKIKVTTLGTDATKSFLVKKYVLPKFKVELEDVRSWYTVDEYINGNVTCDYFFGKHVEGDIEIDVQAYYGVWETVEVFKGKLKNGKFSFELAPTEYAVGLPYNTDNGYLEFNITVTDTGGHKESKSKMVSVAREPILLTMVADSNVRGTTSNHYVIARYPDGASVKNAEVEFWDQRIRERDLDRYYASDSMKTTTDSRGVAKISFTYDNQRYITIRVSDGETSVHETYYFRGSEGLKVIPDDTYYDVGEVAQIQIMYTGEKAVTKWVYYDVLAKGFVVHTGRLKLDKNNRGSISLPITSDMAPLAEIRVYKTLTDLNVAHDLALFGVGTAETGLNVSIDTDRGLYMPNDQITFQFTVTDHGDPVQAALGLAGVDQSVFEIHERFTGLEKVIHDLEEEFITPQYEICNYVYSPGSALGGVPEESVSVVSKTELSTAGKSSMLVVTGTSHLDYANQLENYYGSYYWFTLLFLGLMGFLVLFVLALKYSKARAIVGALLVLLPIFMVGGMLAWVIQTQVSTLGGEEFDDVERGDAVEMFPEDEDRAAKSSYEEGSMGLGGFDGDGTGLDVPTLPDHDSDGTPDEKSDDGDGFKPIQTRQYFPETWFWEPSLITNELGQATLKLTTPDSITTWNVEAVASTKDERFGLGTKNVTVFKGFFIEPDIPLKVVQGDEFPLRILIYNYEHVPNNVTVTLYQSNWYDLLENASVTTAYVNASSVTSVEFRIRALNVGTFKLIVDGDNGAKVDRVIKEMTVEPNGKAIETLVNGGLDNDQIVEHKMELYENRIHNSTNAYVKLQAGLEAVTLDGAENYIQFVSGCGEQSTSKLSVDIAAYKNLLKGDITDEQMLKFETIINQGIQHELTFVVNVWLTDGKGIAYHPGMAPDYWLTAWASFAFQDLLDAGFEVDESILDGFQTYLISKQHSDGSYSFSDEGHWSFNSNVRNERVASTAYVTRALIYTGYSTDSKAIKKSMEYLEKNVDVSDGPFTIALVLLALELGDGDQSVRNSLAEKLNELKQEDVDAKTAWWSYYADSNSYSSRRYNTQSTETTAYAIMALNKHGGYGFTVTKAVRYLLTHRSGGCFGSTHSTAVAFQALNSLDEFGIEDLTVEVHVDNEKIESIQFTKENQDITYLIDLRPYIDPTIHSYDIKLVSKGKGGVIYQIYYLQYLTWDRAELNVPPEMQLNVKYDTTNIKVNDQITATLTLKYTGAASSLKMVLIDLRAPVGFSFIEADFSDLLEAGTINNYELRGRQALVYVNDVQKGVLITFSYSLLANKPIRGTIQGVHAFDMYDPNVNTELGPVEVESYV
jgi:uncharacterized protein YfaS (alpha-2-macroglobulin family)